MVLIPTHHARQRALLAALPTIDADTELILRPDGDCMLATLRRNDAPPRVFAHVQERVVELLPGDDAGLVGAPLLAPDQELLHRTLLPHIGPIADARLVSWRPHRRAVVRIAGSDGRIHWLKLLDPKGYRRATHAFTVLGRPVAPMRLASPTHFLTEHAAYLAPAAPGQSLRTLLAEGRAVPLTTIAQGLLALAYTEVRGELPVLDFAHARTAAVNLLRKAAEMRPELLELGAALDRLPTPPAPRHPSFVHGDLHDKQLFVDEHGTTLIDLEGMAIGDPRFDLVNLAEHVRLRDVQQTGSDSGFGDVVLARWGLLPEATNTLLFRIVVRARLCGVYALRPRWRPLVDRLLHETRSTMANLQ